MEQKVIKPADDEPAVETKSEFAGTPEEYEAMVKKLFKTSGMHDKHAGLMHAAIGIVGEVVGELIPAIERQDDANIKEEFGDLEFFIEAYRMCADLNDDYMASTTDLIIRRGGMHLPPTVGMSRAAAELLDLAKRCWIYGHDLLDKQFTMAEQLATFMVYLDRSYEQKQFEVLDIRKANMEKLIGPKGRFRDQMYTDEAARVRADKKPGE